MDVHTDAGDREYATDVAYLRTFTGDLAPPLLRLVAALNGFPSPPAEDFDYCELGSGNGDTMAALAAAHPRGRFVGVDFNAEHVAFANGLASRGGLANARFLERDFEDLGREALPDFDFIGAHGVLSWVSPAMRRTVLALAAAKLKPGGLLFVSYNALPGWAAIEPLRRLLLEGGAGSEGDNRERARRGLGLAKLLADAGAGYFAQNPAARSMLDTMLQMGLPYVVHEYLQPHWHPMYFTDVAREAAASGLHFIGQLPLHQNYRDLALPPPLVELFKGTHDRVVFEGLKDFAQNEFFRRDVYVKGRIARSEDATREHLDATAFGSLVELGRIQREVRLPHCTLRFAGSLFDALIPALAEGARAIPELARLPELAAFGAAKIREALLHLVLGGQVIPMQRSAPAAGPADAARYRVPLAYNRTILEQRLSNRDPIVLASPVAGTGLVVTMLEAVSIRLLTEIEPADRPAWIRAFVERQPLRLRVGEETVESREEQARVLAEELDHLRARRLPKLVELGVLEPVP